MATAPVENLPAKVPVTAGGKIAAFIPHTLDDAWRIAGALANSGMTPKAYGADQNKIMVGIMAGAEVGLTPFAALQSIAVIGNNPSLWGDGALALVQASGLLDDMEETDDGAAATCRLNRKGRATPIVRKFSMDDAKKAGLAGKTGPWTQYPARMRQMRARAWAMRDGFSDVLKGLHIVEEARDYTTIGSGEVIDLNKPLSAAMLIEQAEPAAEAAEHEPTSEQPNSSAAQEWVDTHLDVIDAAATLNELDKIEQAGARFMTRLATADAGLHAEVVKAYAGRRGALAQEGPSQKQSGEFFADDGGDNG